ncbi:MAG: hypothetical protein ACNA8O_01215 [Cyanobacteriota bacterium]
MTSSQASTFDVFCTNNSDGTLTCSGWDGGETLTCVSSRGRTTSCSTPSGRSFSCVQGLGGVLSCGKTANQGTMRGDGPRCVPAGDGTLVCDEDDPPSEPLLQAPPVPGAMDRLIGPTIDSLRPDSLTIPSLFD